MKEADFSKLDFDSMTAIAQEDPHEFERLRQAAIDEFIESVPPERRERLRGLQWRIDQVRRNCTPLSACLKISKMMWDHLLSNDGLLGHTTNLSLAKRQPPRSSAKILSFPAHGGRSH